MYCPNCGKSIAGGAWRCPECRKMTGSFRRNELAAAIVIVCLAATLLIWQAFEAWVSVLSGLMVALPLYERYAILTCRAVVDFGFWVVLAYIIVALLLRKKMGGVFASGRLALGIARVFAVVTLAVAVAAAVAGADYGILLSGLARSSHTMLTAHRAESSLREIAAAENAYFAAHKPAAYACNLKDLDPNLMRTQKVSAYNLQFDLACADAKAQSYQVLARPTVGFEHNAFCTDERGVIRSVFMDSVSAETAAAAFARCLKEGKPLQL